MPSGLSALQIRILELLADMTPPWTLAGGAALIGFHLNHRATRDLDLFWRDSDEVGPHASRVESRLTHAGLQVDVLQRSPGHVRLQVAAAKESVVVDLVAEPVPAVEEPTKRALGAASLRVDTAHEILVSKLCALLGRRELRDLVDVVGLLAAGGQLREALQDAPKKDGGFSPLTLAWILRDLPVEELATSEGRPDGASLARARDELMKRILAAAKPAEE